MYVDKDFTSYVFIGLFKFTWTNSNASCFGVNEV